MEMPGAQQPAKVPRDPAEPTISALIRAAESGDRSVAESLFSALYSELHRLARRELARGVPVTISATTLLHETYLDLAQRAGQDFSDRAKFMRYAARVMRGLIIDHLRSRHAQKRGGQFELTSYDTALQNEALDDRDVIRLSEALDELSAMDQVLAETVDLKFFCGFTFAEIAAIHGVTERTVQRNWSKARLYLHHTIRSDLSV